MIDKEYQKQWRDQRKQDVITDIQHWGEILLKAGINPTFVVEGLNVEESEMLFEQSEEIRAYAERYKGRYK